MLLLLFRWVKSYGGAHEGSRPAEKGTAGWRDLGSPGKAVVPAGLPGPGCRGRGEPPPPPQIRPLPLSAGTGGKCNEPQRKEKGEKKI